MAAGVGGAIVSAEIAWVKRFAVSAGNVFIRNVLVVVRVTGGFPSGVSAGDAFRSTCGAIQTMTAIALTPRLSRLRSCWKEMLLGGGSVKTLRALLTASVLTLSSPAQASLVGDTVSCNFTLFALLACNTSMAVVDPVVAEFILGMPQVPFLFFADIGASSIRIQELLGPSLGFTFGTFTDSLTLGSLDDPAGSIVGITNFATTGTLGIDASDVSFTAHSVSFRFELSSWEPRSSASFDLVVAPTGVPEPATLVLLGTGVAGIAWARRRKRV